MTNFIPCHIRQLPVEQHTDAARTAVSVNPANAPPINALAVLAEAAFPADRPDHYRLALLTSKYWNGGAGVRLGVSFMDTSDPSLKARILLHMNAWGQTANVSFAESASGQVRIARNPGDGYWSYLGTDILHIPAGQPTMNLDSFSMVTPESEYKRVVRHETGHTLGFPHEHMRAEIIGLLDPQKTISYFMATQGWTREDVIAQVLTPLSESDLKATPHADQRSIMCYQLPGNITKNGVDIPGGDDINNADYDLCSTLYPKQVTPPPPPWKPCHDVLDALVGSLGEKKVAKLKRAWDAARERKTRAGMAGVADPQPALDWLASNAEGLLASLLDRLV